MIALTIALLLAATDTCAYDRAAMLALPAEAFDATYGSGWRPLADRPECRVVAADLIAAWRDAHRPALRSSEVHGSYWHEGQLRAAAGQDRRAVRLLLAGVDPENLDDREDYALGTVAFLQHDLNALQAARARLAAEPAPSWFAKAAAEAQAHGITAKWPPGLAELDRFVACFGRSYSEAYHGACAAEVAPKR